MIHFEIYTKGGNLDRVFLCQDGRFGDEIYYDMYDYLTRRFDLEHERAENAVCWCEFATVGEAYAEDKFEIIITEDGNVQ